MSCWATDPTCFGVRGSHVRAHVQQLTHDPEVALRWGCCIQNNTTMARTPQNEVTTAARKKAAKKSTKRASRMAKKVARPAKKAAKKAAPKQASPRKVPPGKKSAPLRTAPAHKQAPVKARKSITKPTAKKAAPQRVPALYGKEMEQVDHQQRKGGELKDDERRAQKNALPQATFDPTPDTNVPPRGHTGPDRFAQTERVSAMRKTRARLSRPGTPNAGNKKRG